MNRVFANGPGDRGSIPGRFIPMTEKIVLDNAFLNTQKKKKKPKTPNATTAPPPREREKEKKKKMK